MPSDAVDYLINELEMQFAIEKAARDRTETMVQHLLTTIGAVIGAVFLVTGLTENGMLVVFLALLLVFTFAVTTTCSVTPAPRSTSGLPPRGMDLSARVEVEFAGYGYMAVRMHCSMRMTSPPSWPMRNPLPQKGAATSAWRLP